MKEHTFFQQPHHTPVLCSFLLDKVLPEDNSMIVDCTLGEGGHTEAFLKKGRMVAGFDRDPVILEKARQRLSAFSSQVVFHNANFGNAEEIFRSYHGKYGMVLFDLGISVFHYRESGRGFSINGNEPIDMRLDGEGISASDILNTMSLEELRNIFSLYGEEPKARKAAELIVQRRAENPITNSAELSELLGGLWPRNSRSHPATRCFQALRIAVNKELDCIEPGILSAIKYSRAGTRIAVLSYHSLEDRIVKNVFNRFVPKKIRVNKYRLPADINPQHAFRLFSKKPVIPDETEKSENNASRSAKLRVLICGEGI